MKKRFYVSSNNLNGFLSLPCVSLLPLPRSLAPPLSPLSEPGAIYLPVSNYSLVNTEREAWKNSVLNSLQQTIVFCTSGSLGLLLPFNNITINHQQQQRAALNMRCRWDDGERKKEKLQAAAGNAVFKHSEVEAQCSQCRGDSRTCGKCLTNRKCCFALAGRTKMQKCIYLMRLRAMASRGQCLFRITTTYCNKQHYCHY